MKTFARLATTLACACAVPLAALASAPNPHAPAAFGPAASAANPGMAPPIDAAAAIAQRRKEREERAKVNVKLVDLNAASRQELMTLPGIGAADADRIIANRPYLVKSDLVNKKVLPTGPYLAVRKKVVAMPHGKLPKPAKTASSAKPKA